jgi:glycosyltransferase involved in cell wall biosynthesis
MSEFPELMLLLVGDGALREDTAKLVQSLQLSDRVLFTGKVPHADVPDYIAVMDIGVMPESNVFGSPMKVFEYMAMECPPVAPRYGPLEEAISDGRDGLLFTPGDVSDLSACLHRLLSSPETRKRLGASARSKVLNQHQWIHNAQAVIDIVDASPQLPLKTTLKES